MSPLFRILPVKEKTLVPLLFSVPRVAYHSAPRSRIGYYTGEGFDIVD